MEKQMRLEGMNALVTGATSGIGKAVAATLSREGARLVLTGRKPEFAKPDEGDLYLNGDLNDEDFVRDLAGRAAEHCGHLDVVVLGHGRQVSAHIVDMDLADAQDVLHSNLLSAFTVMKHSIPLMPSAGGSIVCISSRLGMVGKPEETMYSAAKGGLIALARGAAIELTDRNIRVNVVAPGLTATEIIEASFQRQPDPDGYRRMRESAIPMRRLATPQEVADAVLFMASPESSYITGAVLPVDGGYTAY
jgi:NAD(P)-dependent dehydrogenase (short-subunit alcohol dehydrogenase family)